MDALPRKKLKRWEKLDVARFLTFSCHGRLPLLGTALWRDFMAATLANARTRCRFELRAWVIMPEHVHLIVVPRSIDWPVPKLTIAIKQPVAQRAIDRWRQVQAPVLDRIRLSDGTIRFWLKGGGFDRNVRDEYELAREIKYIHMNPVRRGLVKLPSDWAWSSARAYLDRPDAMIPIDRPMEGVDALVTRHLHEVENGVSDWGSRQSDRMT